MVVSSQPRWDQTVLLMQEDPPTSKAAPTQQPAVEALANKANFRLLKRQKKKHLERQQKKQQQPPQHKRPQISRNVAENKPILPVQPIIMDQGDSDAGEYHDKKYGAMAGSNSPLPQRRLHSRSNVNRSPNDEMTVESSHHSQSASASTSSRSSDIGSISSNGNSCSDTSQDHRGRAKRPVLRKPTKANATATTTTRMRHRTLSPPRVSIKDDKSVTKTASRESLSTSTTAAVSPLSSSSPRPPSNNSAPAKSTGNIHMPGTGRPLFDYSFEPKITARYPLTDHEDSPLNPMIVQFCYPSGDVILPSKTYQLPRVHHFVLTNERGRKIYATCLTVFEEFVVERSSPWFRRSLTCEDEQSMSEEAGIEVSVNKSSKQALYVPKVLCLLSTWPYLTAFREYLAQIYRLATATNIMTTPIERYIVNLCSEIPAPPPGAYEVQVGILTSTIRFWAPPAKLPIAYVALPFQILFECLDLDNILTLWSAMILERKVLLLSSQYSILTVCCEILCSLLFPMRWSHLYIPLMPRMLCPMLDAPVPYLAGVVRENWLHAQQFVSEDTIVVDLDRNSVIFGEAVPPTPPVPPKKWNKLRSTLQDTAGHVFWRARGLEREYKVMMTQRASKRAPEMLLAQGNGSGTWVEKLASLDNAYNLAFTPDSPNLLNDTLPADEQSMWDRVQEAFLRFFVALLKQYRRYLKIPIKPVSDDGKDNKKSGTSLSATKPSFDRIGYLASQKAEHAQFLVELCMTQQFDDFLTRRMYSPGEPDLLFFDQKIDAKMNRSKLKLRKVETPLLQSAKAHKELRKFYAVEPSGDGLPEYDHEAVLKTYLYKNWPEKFDEDFFCEPRRIPKMISAEFDRQKLLVAKLRNGVLPDEEDEDEFGGDCSSSPEVAAFTLFFFVYAAFVGKEWQVYQKKRREEEANALKTGERKGEAIEAIETVLPNFEVTEADLEAAEGCIGDLSLGLCGDTCNDDSMTLESMVILCGIGANNVYKMFQGPADHLATLQLHLSEQTDGAMGMPEGEDRMIEYEEAREIAAAQLDLAFETLTTMGLRGLSTDADAYLSLMEACGRCGDTQRALNLLELMKHDGFVADSEVLACFISAFARDQADGVKVGSSGSTCSTGTTKTGASDAYSAFLNKRLHFVKRDGYSNCPTFDSFKPALGGSVDGRDGASLCSETSSKIQQSGGSALLDWFTQHQIKPWKKKEKRRRRRQSATLNSDSMQITEMITRQVSLGESLLDSLYPNLVIDTNSDSCPHCSDVLSEDDVISGWSPCAFQDFTTKCPKCQHRFVPRFAVSTTSRNFEGSQGPRTPLYCEFLSPWVVRKEIQHFIKGDIGIEGILKPSWRAGTGIEATLFWNLMVLCRRYRLPFTFLLQGNFANSRLILPRKPNEM